LSDNDQWYFLINSGAAGTSQYAAGVGHSQTETNDDVGLGQAKSKSHCIEDETSNSELQTPDSDVMQTAEDILDDLDKDWVESTLIKLLMQQLFCVQNYVIASIEHSSPMVNCLILCELCASNAQWHAMCFIACDH